MRILHTVESYLPSRNGMQEVVTRISEGMVNFGHSVTIATSKDINRDGLNINGVQIVQFFISGNSVFGYKGDIEEYLRFLREANFDIVVNFAAQTWSTDLCFSIIKEIRGVKVFVPTGFSGLFSSIYQEYYSAMPITMALYDMNVFLSYRYRDYVFAKTNGLTNICVIPNGASKSEFGRLLPKSLLKYRKGNRILLSVGNHTGIKGHGDLIEIFKKLSCQRMTLIIAGKSPHSNEFFFKSFIKEIFYRFFGKIYSCYFQCRIKAFIYNISIKRLYDKKQIIMLEGSRDQVVEAYGLAKMFLLTSNIECSPVVLFESIASRTPFATVAVGNSEEIIEWTNGGVLLPTHFKNGYSYVSTNDSVKKLNGILKDKVLLEQLSDQGYNSFLEEFTWEQIVEKYQKLYNRLIENND